MPFEYAVVDNSPLSGELLWSTLIVAIKTNAKLVQAKLTGETLTLTFDKELSQSDIVHILTEGLE